MQYGQSQQTRVVKNRRDRKLYRWRKDKPEVKEKQREFREEMTKNAKRFSELLESIGTTENDTKRDNAGDRIVEGWERLVKNTAGAKSNREKVDNLQQSSRMVGRGKKEATGSKERGVGKIYIEQNYGRLGGVCYGQKESNRDGRDEEEEGIMERRN